MTSLQVLLFIPVQSASINKWCLVMETCSCNGKTYKCKHVRL